MGQLIALLKESENGFDEDEEEDAYSLPLNAKDKQITTVNVFPDLSLIPRELSLAILSNLNATDLCLAACVWRDLAHDELLWRELCRNQWPYCSAYKRWLDPGFSFRGLYLRLDEASLTFKADAFQGMDYLHKHAVVDEDAWEIAQFFHHSQDLDREQCRRYLEEKTPVLDELMKLKSCENQFLPNALRKFFKEVPAPNVRNEYLSRVVDHFSRLYVQGNSKLNLTYDQVYILCFSLIMLSVDLCSPHVKNKMSKREFIRNTRGASMEHISDDYLGHLYDNVYLVGHVAGRCGLMLPSSPLTTRRRRWV